MGGKAFSEQLPAAVFPRMPTPFYNSLKARVVSRLEVLYCLVAVPPEVPGKIDHGDLDVLVSKPKNVKEGVPLSDCVTPTEIEKALGSVHSFLEPGDGTLHLAIPIQQDGVQHFAIDQDEVKEGKIDLGQLYVQVDLHFCKDMEAWESRLFFQSYGELGRILSKLAETAGFAWSKRGLKLFRYETSIPNTPYGRLSTSQPEILEFFGLDHDAHAQGFATTQRIFDWVAASRFFNPHLLLPALKTIKYEDKSEKKLYHEFVNNLESLVASAEPEKPLDVRAIQDEALSSFGKRKEFDDAVRDRYLREEAKKAFNGNLVKEWTGLSFWKDLQVVTDEMRVRVLDGTGPTKADWREKMIELSEEERKALALKLTKELIPPKPTAAA